MENFSIRTCLQATITLVGGLALSVTLHGPVLAGPCDVAPPSAAAVSGPPLTLDERADILDLISNYSWAFDEQRNADLAALFTSDIDFTVCSGSPPGIIYRVTTASDLLNTFNQQISELQTLRAQTRHFSTNTIFITKPYVNGAGKRSVQTKTMVMVVIKPFDQDTPVIDYSATATAEVVQTADVDKGEASAWKFSIRKMSMDMPALVVYGR
jgi:hypothetical protein